MVKYWLFHYMLKLFIFLVFWTLKQNVNDVINVKWAIPPWTIMTTKTISIHRNNLHIWKCPHFHFLTLGVHALQHPQIDAWLPARFQPITPASTQKLKATLQHFTLQLPTQIIMIGLVSNIRLCHHKYHHIFDQDLLALIIIRRRWVIYLSDIYITLMS